MSYNHRDFVKKSRGIIIVDEDKLDIYWKDPTPIQPWQPQVQLKPYQELSQLFVDIETAGIDPIENRIYAIGCMDEMGYPTVFMNISEAQTITDFFNHLKKKNPDVIFTYNGMEFDIPFIITRSNLHGIKHPFKIASKSRTIRTAKVRGEPLKIREVFVQNSQHVDVYICVLRWDFVTKKLTNGRSLKKAVLDMGLRQNTRLVLPYEEILACWKDGPNSKGWKRLKEYLVYDLEDTQLIANRLVPSYYYEALIVPEMNLQQLALAGNGTKWERIFEHHYPGYKPKPDRKYKFQGGMAYSIPGLYRKVGYADISSMHPWAMLDKGICSIKDTKRIGLSILQYLVNEKSRLEQLASSGNIAAKEKRESVKVLANSEFGFFGTSELAFNDMEAAALVTAYSRKVLKLMIEIITYEGGTPVEVDTDGVFFTHPNPEEIHCLLQSQLPEGITVKLEFIASAMFIPERGTKNYLLWLPHGKIITKGNWRNRDRSQLEKEFSIQYLTLLIQDISAAEEYYTHILSHILSREYPKENLCITRRIKEGEKELLKLGKPGDVVTYYYSILGVTDINSLQKYSSQYYIKLLAQKRVEILQIANPKMLNSGKQLTLF
ncbi:MAG: ribonuclease H-like domain-containing protein [Tolypothrix carrinoi HA7290-LM1]|jgi:DNA polymerase elongation subunit (family B)|nr:ribonuclease H-like domain-containing protein [Tolypothrix carrinoi HA7290-LM1]